MIHLNGGQRLPEVDDILKHDLDTSNGNIQLELETLKEDYKEFAMKMTSVIASEQQIRSEFDHYKKGNLPKNIAGKKRGMCVYFTGKLCHFYLYKSKNVDEETIIKKYYYIDRNVLSNVPSSRAFSRQNVTTLKSIRQ